MPPALEPLELEGFGVRLEPLDLARHHDGLAAAIGDGALWSIPVTFVPEPEQLREFFADAAQASQAGRELAFATIDARTGRVVGSTRFRMFEATHRRVEIGFTFLAASVQRSHVNTTAKYLMLAHAFEGLALNRVEFLTDVLNDRSRRAIERLGAPSEGVLRAHMVMRDGRIRDSAMYAITRGDWPAVEANLRGRLERTIAPA